jgi:O-antigen/teichoic acid export membrane protein
MSLAVAIPAKQAVPNEGPPIRKAVAGSAALWTVTGFGVMQALRFAANLLLTWLLFREVFGLMALVDVFLQGLHMFSDVGIGSSIVRSKRHDRDFLDTAWTLQAVRGCVLWCGSCLLAWPVAAFYGVPLLCWLIPSAALTAAVNGFNSTALFTLERRLAQGRLALLQIGSYVAGMAVTLAWLQFVEPTVWALVIGRVVGSVLEMVGSHCLTVGPLNRFRWEAPAVRELVHFGKWIFFGTACTFLADQADRLTVGKLEGTGTLGVYQIAVQLALVPKLLMYALVPKLIFPLYGRAHQDGRGVTAAFRRLHGPAAAFEAFLVTGLISCGPALVRCLFKADYHEAGWMLQLVAVGAWLAMLESTGGAVLWAAGQSRTSAVSNAAKALTVPLLATAGFYLGGLPGLLLGFAAADLVRYAVTAVALHRFGCPVLSYDLPLTALIALTALPSLWLGQWLGGPWKWLQLGVSVGAVVLTWSGLLLGAWLRLEVRSPRHECRG